MMVIPVIASVWHDPFRHAFWLSTINNLKLHINFYKPPTSIKKHFLVYSKTFSSFKINIRLQMKHKTQQMHRLLHCPLHTGEITDRHNHKTAQIWLDSAWLSSLSFILKFWMFCCCLVFVHGKKCYLSLHCYFFRTFWMRMWPHLCYTRTFLCRTFWTFG